MPATDADLERVLRLLIQDLRATIGPRYDVLAATSARCYLEFRAWTATPEEYTRGVVEDVQQQVHDEFIATDWPKCPHHSHPLWFRDGAWCCDRHGVRIALGELGSI